MRRYNPKKAKCFGKHKYSFRDDAFRQVLMNFFKGNKGYGIYECPKCLEFHITSNYDNRTTGQRWHCLDKLCKSNFQRTHDLVKERYQLMQQHLREKNTTT